MGRFVSTSAVTVGKFFAISRRSVPVLMSHSSRGLSLNTTTRYCLKTNITNTRIQSQHNPAHYPTIRFVVFTSKKCQTLVAMRLGSLKLAVNVSDYQFISSCFRKSLKATRMSFVFNSLLMFLVYSKEQMSSMNKNFLAHTVLNYSILHLAAWSLPLCMPQWN